MKVVIVMPLITGECTLVVEAVCSILLITIVELDTSKSLPLAAVAYVCSNKLRFSSGRVRYGPWRIIAYMLRNLVRK
jgi:hypothetical protein